MKNSMLYIKLFKKEFDLERGFIKIKDNLVEIYVGSSVKNQNLFKKMLRSNFYKEHIVFSTNDGSYYFDLDLNNVNKNHWKIVSYYGQE